MSIQTPYWLCPLFVGLVTLTAPRTTAAQAPINGFNATIALPSSVDKFYSDVHTVLVKTSDGVEHRVHVTKGTTAHGGPASLDSLKPGTAVAVHYTVKGIQASADEIDLIGPEGLRVNEGTVTNVDRARKRITIAFSNGTRETLRLRQHVAEESDEHAPKSSRVIVYYPDESGQRVAHYFKPLH
jgi:hypothetical protein